MADEKESDLPIFPIEEFASSVRKSERHEIENDDIRTQEDLDLLMELMWRHPERRFYLYCKKGKHVNSLNQQAEHSGELRFEETHFRFYPHPNFKHDYVKLEPPFQFDWEEETAASAPEHLRIELALTPNERRRRDSAEVAGAVATSLPQPPHRLEAIFRQHGLLFYVMAIIVGVIVAAVFAL